MNNALKKITAQAKKLQKDHPQTPWPTLIKKASAQYRSGSIGSGKKVSSKTVSGKKVSGVFKKKSTPVKRRVQHKSETAGLTPAAAKYFMQREYEDKLGRLEVRLFNTIPKRKKNAIRKDIKEVKKVLSKLKSI